MSKRTLPPGQLEQELLDRLASLQESSSKKRTRRGSRGRARVRFAGLTALFAVLGLGVAGVFAVHDEGFQLDGNATAADLSHGEVCIDHDGDNKTACIQVDAGNLTGAFAGPYDWNSLFDITGTPAPGNAQGTVTGPKATLPGSFVAANFQKDFGNSGTTFLTADSTTFATGSKDELDIPDWQCNTDNNVNSKTDIINGFAAIWDDGTDEIVYFGLEKDVDNGNNNVGIWLLQDQNVGCTSAGGNTDFTGEHMVGDILIVSAFTNGGGVSNIDVYQWNPGNGTADDPLEKIDSGVDCLIEGGGDSFCATVFQPDTEGGDDTLTMPWLSADNSVVNAPHPSPNFYEGGINLSDFPQFADRCFTGYLLDTRSSQSTDATLFDYVFGDFGTCEPEIEVTKVASETDVCAGADTEITYTYTVTNTGNVDLTNIDISDDTIPGAQAAFELENGSDDLDEGAAPVEFTLTATINATTTNIVTVDADSQVGADSASDTATATVTAHDCTISITKTPDEEDVCAGADTEITYTYEVTNNSDLFDATVDIWDDAGTPGDTGDDVLVADDLAVAAGATESDTESFTVNATTTNTATATATFDDPADATDQATADATVTAHDCTISITKTPDEEDVCAGADTSITYTYEVTNNSDLFDATVDIWDDAGTPGDTGDDVLVADDLAVAAGATESDTESFTVNATTTNTATATATFNDPADATDQATADATVTAHDCTITITKTPSDTDVCNGGTVDYDYLVTNNSDEFDWTGDVIDDMGTPGDTADDELLADDVTIAAGGNLPLSLDNVVINGVVTNIVTADGSFDDPDATAASDTDTATVTGTDCTITITKTPSAEDVCNGKTVDYDYLVSNPSDFDWTGDVVDDMGTPGDTSDDELLADDVTIAAGGNLPLSLDNVAITGTVTNIVTADGAFDDPDATAASDTDTATVTGHNCTITITKTPSAEDVCNGKTVDYDYLVTNNSDEFDWTGDVVDDMGTPGDASDDELLADDVTIAAGGNLPLSLDNVVINGSVTNTVTADGAFDDPDATAASDTDDATVVGHDCTISITKTPSATEVCNGDLVNYDYLVTNNSDEFDWTGDVVDDMGTPGDTSDDELLADDVTIAAGGSLPLELNGVAITGSVTNTVTADGNFDDPDATAASDTDTATVVGTPCGGGCTPGFWQGGNGRALWNAVNDLDWIAAGGEGTNPFTHTTLFKDGPWVDSGNATVDNSTMLQIVGTGGGSSPARKAARDLVAAYLNASFGAEIGYPASTADILADWAAAVAGGSAGFKAFHAEYGPLNQLGCTI